MIQNDVIRRIAKVCVLGWESGDPLALFIATEVDRLYDPEISSDKVRVWHVLLGMRHVRRQMLSIEGELNRWIGELEAKKEGGAVEENK